MLRYFAFLLLLASWNAPHAAAETILVAKDKMHALRLERPAHHVMIGNSEVADVTVEKTNLVYVLGKRVGTTHLVILDGQSKPILSAEIVVGPDRENTVTVISPQFGKQTGTAEVRYVCGERCAAEAGNTAGQRNRPDKVVPPAAGPPQN